MIGFGETRPFSSIGGRLQQRWRRPAANPPGPEAPPFSVVHADGLGGLCQASSAFGLVPPFPLAGRPFWPDLLGMTGVDVSFLKVLPGGAAPFAMRHRRNEVVYVVAAGRGQFLIDGRPVDVEAGTVLRVHPRAVRAWRNVSAEDLLLIVVQARNDSRRRPTRSDAVGLAGLIPWWRHPWSRPRPSGATSKSGKG